MIDKYSVIKVDIQDPDFRQYRQHIYVYRVIDREMENDEYLAEFEKRVHAEYFVKALNSGKIK